jgi:hypothetical protein
MHAIFSSPRFNKEKDSTTEGEGDTPLTVSNPKSLNIVNLQTNIYNKNLKYFHNKM